MKERERENEVGIRVSVRPHVFVIVSRHMVGVSDCGETNDRLKPRSERNNQHVWTKES